VSRATLFVLGGRDVGRSFDVEHEALLGRDATCAVRLADRSISRKHARIAYDGLEWVLQDLGSRNGIRVGGKRVERVTLADLDEFLLGELPLRFRLAQEERGTVPPSTLPITPPSAPSIAPPGTPPEPTPRPEPAREEELALEEEITLEGEFEEPASAAPAAAPAPRLADRDLRRAQVLRGGSGGFLQGDLAQRPLWVRGLVALLVVALFAAVLFAAYRIVQGVRGTL